jgi:hypothetical protein
MIEDNFKKELKRINPTFTETDIKKGLQCFELVEYQAKDIASKAGQIAEYLFFVDRSITRCFYLDDDEKENTLWMKPEQTFIAEYKSFTSSEPSRFSLQFYENTQTYRIKRTDLLELFTEYNSWALFGIHLTEQLHTTLIDVFVNLLANDATNNYRYIEYAFPRFIQVAPLKDIASMLQVSQVSLSRIRSGNQLKK